MPIYNGHFVENLPAGGQRPSPTTLVDIRSFGDSAPITAETPPYSLEEDLYSLLKFLGIEKTYVLKSGKQIFSQSTGQVNCLFQGERVACG